MRDLVPIEVECYAGYKADEHPKRFYCTGIKFEITEIIDRWYQGEPSPGPPANYFKVRTKDGKQYILKQEQGSGKWFLFIRGETLNLFPRD